MLITIMAVLALQAPQDATATSAQPAPSAAPAPTTRRARRNETVTCQERAPTGSTLRRTICSTERRAEADRDRAQRMATDAGSGLVNGEMFPGGTAAMGRLGPG